MDRTVDGVLFEESKHCLQECRKFGLTHFACGHRKLAMTHAAKPAHVAVDCDVVRRIGEHEFRLGAFEQAIVSGFISSIAASVSYTHLRAHETRHDLVCRLL